MEPIGDLVRLFHRRGHQTSMPSNIIPWQMAAAKLSDGAFLAILEAHPGLRERFVSIALAVADAEGNLKEADAIEERMVEEMRLLGREAMQGGAGNQGAATERETRPQRSM